MGFHCLLEVLPGFEFLRCEQAHAEATDPGCHCDDAACHTVEAGLYLMSKAQPAPGSQQLLLVVALIHQAEFDRAPTSGLPVLSPVPPDLPGTWQFTLRTALPPRAPSSIS